MSLFIFFSICENYCTLSVNQELLILYYSIGKIINEHKA